MTDESPAQPTDVRRVRLFGVDIDVLTMDETMRRIMRWLDAPEYDCRYVVTPNVDHTILLHENPRFHAAYGSASMVVADGFPVIMASKLLGKRLPERVAGSELVPLLLAEQPADRQLTCFLLGAQEGVADRAAEKITQQWPGVKVVGTYSPPFGFDTDAEETQKIREMIDAAAPELLLFGVGAPKQEIWVHENYQTLNCKVLLCIGATIDFIAGEKKQAPVWMRRTGLEWVFRMLSEPRRLVGRYARDAMIFPRLVWRELKSR